MALSPIGTFSSSPYGKISTQKTFEVLSGSIPFNSFWKETPAHPLSPLTCASPRSILETPDERRAREEKPALVIFDDVPASPRSPHASFFCRSREALDKRAREEKPLLVVFNDDSPLSPKLSSSSSSSSAATAAKTSLKKKVPLSERFLSDVRTRTGDKLYETLAPLFITIAPQIQSYKISDVNFKITFKNPIRLNLTKGSYAPLTLIFKETIEGKIYKNHLSFVKDHLSFLKRSLINRGGCLVSFSRNLTSPNVVHMEAIVRILGISKKVCLDIPQGSLKQIIRESQPQLSS